MQDVGWLEWHLSTWVPQWRLELLSLCVWFVPLLCRKHCISIAVESHVLRSQCPSSSPHPLSGLSVKWQFRILHLILLSFVYTRPCWDWFLLRDSFTPFSHFKDDFTWPQVTSPHQWGVPHWWTGNKPSVSCNAKCEQINLARPVLVFCMVSLLFQSLDLGEGIL